MNQLYSKMNSFYMRAVWKYRRTVSKYLYCRMLKLRTTSPIISFSFDDAPRTAFTTGSQILNRYGAPATFYVSLGKLGSDSPSGPLASFEDLINAVKEGHELGCHTFDHKHSWETKTEIFVQSVQKNHQVLSSIIPEAEFLSLAYPICDPKPTIKREMGKIFCCCRGGDQTFNIGETDLNLLNAFFLDIRIGDSVDRVKQLIDENAKAKGWLIFVTHDVRDNPSKYGCSSTFLEQTVKHAAKSGSLLLPVGKACRYIQN